MKKKLLILLTLMFFTPFAVNAYEVKMDWQKSYDIAGNPYFTKDGGIIVLSDNYDSIQDDYDCIITKYDKEGNMLWKKNWGGNSYDAFRTMLLTEDDGVIVYADSHSTDIEDITYLGGADIVLIKYDKDGNVAKKLGWK